MSQFFRNSPLGVRFVNDPDPCFRTFESPPSVTEKGPFNFSHVKVKTLEIVRTEIERKSKFRKSSQKSFS